MTALKIKIGLIRHGPTLWNRQGRLQGRSDQPLDSEGRAEVSGWTIPQEMMGWRVLSSPLVRAVETARIAMKTEAELDPRLIETDFGDWEGERLEDLRSRLGDRMREREDLGRDFKAPGGESPSDLMARLKPCFRELADTGENYLIFCHKGIIRATLAWATGWNMLGKPPVKTHPATVHEFGLDPAGAPILQRANIPLLGPSQ